MSSLWLTKDIARLILAHTDLATTWALALTCKLLCKEIRGGALLLKRAEGRLLDFQPKRQEELSVKTVRELMEMDRKVWKTRLRLVLFGDGGVGKTASSIMFTNNFFVEEYDPTTADSYRKIIEVDAETLNFIEVAGPGPSRAELDPSAGHIGHQYVCCIRREQFCTKILESSRMKACQRREASPQ